MSKVVGSKEKVYTYSELRKMGINPNTLTSRFYRGDPKDFGIKEYKIEAKAMAVNQKMFNRYFRNLLPKAKTSI